MFGNKLLTALVTLKTMADQQSACGSSLKVVLVAVQCMRQYTENSLGCSTTKYTNVGGRWQYSTQSGKPLPARRTVTDCIGTVTDHNRYHHWPHRYTDYSTPFACSSILPSQETGADTFYFEPRKVPSFNFFNFSCGGSFLFGQSSKRLPADRLRCERLYVDTTVGFVTCQLRLRG